MKALGRTWTLLATVMLLLTAGSVRAELRAWFDRSTVSMGETVTLNVEADGSSEPDFSPLEQDFRIAGRSTSTQMQIINGAMARTNLWAVALEPLREGVISIAPLRVGNDRTGPLSLNVQPMARGSAAAGDDVFLEVEVDTNTPYVQQQVAYVVRLFYAVSLLDGNLDEPAGDGLQVRRVGEDVNFSRQLGARRYNVVERRYAVSADHSGPLSLRPITFRGRVAAGRYGSFFSQGNALTTGSETIQLDVRPAPAGAPMPWLPARALKLADDASRLPAQARVGDALELTLEVEATGLSAEQIPELELPRIEGAEVYPDQETRENGDAGGRVTGKRTRRFAIVPQRAGTLELPERSLTWWNLDDDRAQRSILPARRIEIVAADPGTALAMPPAGVEPGADSSQPGTAMSNSRRERLWQAAAAAFALAWLATLALWWYRSRQWTGEHQVQAGADAGQGSSLWRAALAHALAREDLGAVRRALLRIRPELGDLESLAASLEDAGQGETVRRLDRVLYRGDPDAGLLEQVRTAFARSPRFRDAMSAAPSRAPELPPLYPPSRPSE